MKLVLKGSNLHCSQESRHSFIRNSEHKCKEATIGRDCLYVPSRVDVAMEVELDDRGGRRRHD